MIEFKDRKELKDLIVSLSQDRQVDKKKVEHVFWATGASEEGFYAEWETGGIGGGSCWGGENVAYSTGYPEPEFELLDCILEKVKPDVTFLQYKRLLSKTKYGTKKESDSYGNHTEYATKLLSFDEVAESLGDWMQLPKTPAPKVATKATKKEKAKRKARRI